MKTGHHLANGPPIGDERHDAVAETLESGYRDDPRYRVADSVFQHALSELLLSRAVDGPELMQRIEEAHAAAVRAAAHSTAVRSSLDR